MATAEPFADDRSAAKSGVSLRWADRLTGLRDRLLSSARFRRWAVTFPLTRPIARRRTRALFDLCSGFVYSQILFACVQLGLFETLAEGPQNTAELARRLSLPVDATGRLLAAAVSLRLVAVRGDNRFGLGALGTAMIDNQAVTAMIRHHAILYDDLRDPVALLRGESAETGLGRYWAYARSSLPARLATDQVAEYSTLMAVSQSMIAEEILAAYPLSRHRRLLDVGGGDGAFLAAATAHAPQLKAILIDLPPVVERARARFAGSTAQARVDVVGGDFLSAPLPRGADLVSLIRVLHDHDDQSALTALRAIRNVLPADGRLLVAEPMSGTKGSEPVSDAYFGFYLLAMGSGRPRTPDEIGKLLLEAGFSRWREVATTNPLLVRVILGHP